MSGIYVKGVVAPAMCDCCDFRTGVGGGFGLGKCLFTHSVCEPHIKPTNCHVTFVPDHGRLGDLDALEEYLSNDPTCITVFDALRKLRSMPTIIPADKEGE